MGSASGALATHLVSERLRAYAAGKGPLTQLLSTAAETERGAWMPTQESKGTDRLPSFPLVTLRQRDIAKRLKDGA